MLIQKQADATLTTSIGSNLLHISAYEGHGALIDFFLQSRFDIDARDIYGHTALHYAVMGNQAKIVRQLLDRGANAKLSNKDFSKPEHLARRKAYLPLYKMLYNHRKKVEAEKKSTPSASLCCHLLDCFFCSKNKSRGACYGPIAPSESANMAKKQVEFSALSIN